MASNKVYITGATGRLGSAVLAKIDDAIPLVRNASGLKNEIATNFSVESLKGILKDATTIIHIAGSVETTDKAKLREANVELTRRLVDSAPKGSKIIFASSVSVYGKKLKEKPANEQTSICPDSDYAKSKYDAENIVAKHPNHVILRIGTIYGPQFSDYAKILKKIKQGKMIVIGNGKNHIPFVHVDDVVDVFKNAIDKGGGVYVIAGEQLTQNEIYVVASKALKVKPPKKHIAFQIAMLATRLKEIASKITGKKPELTVEHISVLAFDREFDCSRAEKELGFRPRQLEKGINDIVMRMGAEL
jgi:nucleoside-diphosphate-sugar epimerase